jgi:hypothetical protein
MKTTIKKENLDLTQKNQGLEYTIGYYLCEHYGCYVGVCSYEVDENGVFTGRSIGTYFFCKKTMDAAGIPFIGVKKENPNIAYL